MFSYLSLHLQNIGCRIPWCGNETGQISTRDPTHLTRRWVDSSYAVGAASIDAPLFLGLPRSCIPLLAVPEPSHAKLGILLGMDASLVRSCFPLAPSSLPETEIELRALRPSKTGPIGGQIHLIWNWGCFLPSIEGSLHPPSPPSLKVDLYCSWCSDISLLLLRDSSY